MSYMVNRNNDVSIILVCVAVYTVLLPTWRSHMATWLRCCVFRLDPVLCGVVTTGVVNPRITRWVPQSELEKIWNIWTILFCSIEARIKTKRMEWLTSASKIYVFMIKSYTSCSAIPCQTKISPIGKNCQIGTHCFQAIFDQFEIITLAWPLD